MLKKLLVLIIVLILLSVLIGYFFADDYINKDDSDDKNGEDKNGGDNGNDIVRRGTGISVVGLDYIEFYNFYVDSCIYGGYIRESNYTKFSNCYMENPVYGFHFEGLAPKKVAAYNTIENCKIIQADARGISLYEGANYTTIKGCYIESAGITDYYIKLDYCSHCTITDCEIVNIDHSLHTGHGYIVKDTTNAREHTLVHSNGNVFSNCISSQMEEALAFTHKCQNNLFTDCIVRGNYTGSRANTAIKARNGAHNNVWRNITVDITAQPNFVNGISIGYVNNEGKETVPYDNLFENVIFSGPRNAVSLFISDNNTLKNAVVHNSINLFQIGEENLKNFELRNVIVNSVSTFQSRELKGDNPQATYKVTYSCFNNNDFETPNGTGNIETNPLFADVPISDFHINSTEGRWSGSEWMRDSISSSCIDMGDPNDDYRLEPEPNGGRINIGAYGGSLSASKSPSRGRSSDLISPSPNIEQSQSRAVSGKVYYVSIIGNDSNDGESPEKPWRTLKFASSQAKAGDTVYIKKGNYGFDALIPHNSGNSTHPIIFIGYDNTPGDNPTNKLNMPKIYGGEKRSANSGSRRSTPLEKKQNDPLIIGTSFLKITLIGVWE